MSATEKAWSDISDDARIWIWSSPQQLTGEQKEHIRSHLKSFLPQWTSHHVALTAGMKILHDYFIVVALDESASTSASGCSIDALTHQISHLSNQLKIELQDRSMLYFLKDEAVLSISMADIDDAVEAGTISKQTLAFDTLVKNKGELTNTWVKPADESWHARFIR